MVIFFLFFVFGLQFATPSWGHFPKTPRPLHIVVFDGPADQNHGIQVRKLFRENGGACSSFFSMHSVFDSDGKFDFVRIKSVLESLKQKISSVDSGNKSQRENETSQIQPQYLLHFGWNRIYTSQYSDLVELLKSLANQSDVVLVAASGAPNPKEKGTLFLKPISETVMGKIPEAFLIGALGDNGKLDYQSYYGSEIFTALTPPPNLKGSSFSAPLFSRALACHWAKLAIAASDMKLRLRAKRAKIGSLYPTLNELF